MIPAFMTVLEFRLVLKRVHSERERSGTARNWKLGRKERSRRKRGRRALCIIRHLNGHLLRETGQQQAVKR